MSTSEYVLLEKAQLEKGVIFKRFDYSSLGSEWKIQADKTDTEKDQYKFFKGPKNAITNNREDKDKVEEGVKAENDEIGDMGYYYIGEECMDLFDNICMD